MKKETKLPIFKKISINIKEMTTKRPNRRNKYDPYGKKYKMENKKCVVVVDTSYSCYDDLPLFLSSISPL